MKRIGINKDSLSISCDAGGAIIEYQDSLGAKQQYKQPLTNMFWHKFRRDKHQYAKVIEQQLIKSIEYFVDYNERMHVKYSNKSVEFLIENKFMAIHLEEDSDLCGFVAGNDRFFYDDNAVMRQLFKLIDKHFKYYSLYIVPEGLYPEVTDTSVKMTTANKNWTKDLVGVELRIIGDKSKCSQFMQNVQLMTDLGFHLHKYFIDTQDHNDFHRVIKL